MNTRRDSATLEDYKEAKADWVSRMDFIFIPASTMAVPHSFLLTGDDLQRKALDIELAKIEEMACTLRSQRNKLAPVSKLPLEVLSHIFLLYQRSFQGPDMDLYEATSIDHRTPRDFRMPLDWIKLTHVSQQWRATAFQLPKFWSHYSFKSLMLAKDFLLARTQACDLVFRDAIDARYENVAVCGLFFYQHLDRLREIDLAGFDVIRRVLDPQITLQSCWAPRLHTLRLACAGPAHGAASEHDTNTLTAVLGRTSVLRVLEIDFPLQCDAPALYGLTHLKIAHGVHIHTPPAAEFVAALGAMQNLQLLHLVGDALPLRVGEPPTVFTALARRRTYLPSLRTLILNSTVDSLHFFLESIDIPRTARIRLSSCRHAARTDIPYVSMIASRIKHMYWPPGCDFTYTTRIHSLEIAFFTQGNLVAPSYMVKLNAWDSIPLMGARAAVANEPIFLTESLISLELPWTPHNSVTTWICQDAPSQLSDIAHALREPCSTLTMLALRVRDNKNISNAFIVSDTYFLDVFGVQPNLRAVYINPPMLHSLLHNLCPPTPQPQQGQQMRMAPESPPTILFPALCLLHITSNFRLCVSDQELFAKLFQREIVHQRLDTLSIPKPKNPDGPYTGVAFLAGHVTNFVQRPR